MGEARELVGCEGDLEAMAAFGLRGRLVGFDRNPGVWQLQIGEFGKEEPVTQRRTAEALYPDVAFAGVDI